MEPGSRNKNSIGVSSGQPNRRSVTKNQNKVSVTNRVSCLGPSTGDSIATFDPPNLIYSKDDSQIKKQKVRRVRPSAQSPLKAEHLNSLQDLKRSSIESGKVKDKSRSPSNRNHSEIQNEFDRSKMEFERKEMSFEDSKKDLKKRLINSFKLDPDFIEANYNFKMTSDNQSYMIISAKVTQLDRISNLIREREEAENGKGENGLVNKNKMTNKRQPPNYCSNYEVLDMSDMKPKTNSIAPTTITNDQDENNYSSIYEISIMSQKENTTHDPEPNIVTSTKEKVKTSIVNVRKSTAPPGKGEKNTRK